MEHGHPERGRERGFSEFVDLVKSWIPRRSERHESRDFWMPDHICRVCYECDAQFTLFNRKHHCRHCGRVFCAKCTANSVPVSSNDCKRGREDGERIRVCNYCYKQWEQEMAVAAMAAAVAAEGAGDNNEFRCSSPGLSQSPSATSLASTKSSCTVNSSSTIGGGSLLYATRPYQHVSYGSSHSISQPLLTEHDNQETQRSMDSVQEVGVPSPDQFGYCLSRSDDEDDDYGGCPSESEGQCFHPSSGYYNHVGFNDIDRDGSVQGNNETREFCTPPDESTGHKILLNIDSVEAELDNTYDCDASSIYNMEEADAEPVDFENNGVLWFPPAPENEEDDKDVFIFNEEEDDDATGEFRYLRTSGSFGSGESRSRERNVEEHRKAMKNVLDGHFKALVSQLLQVENLPEGEEGDKDSWLEIVTSLSWEVASLLKPDTSKGGGMDPGGYAKIKCLASGRPSERFC